jgi:3alpha(or 20beta)-hydroxysteroid dehydrogenase
MGDRLRGKIALITGGARGMGESHARGIVAEGGQVVIADVLDEAGIALANELAPNAAFVHLDVTNTAEWDNAIAESLKAFGKMNVLINNAGILTVSPISDLTDEKWDRLIGINLTGTFKGIRAAAPTLAKFAPSSIINVSSTAGLAGFSGGAAYGSSKFAIRGLTKVAALELGREGVRVNSIHPGNVNTPMTSAFADAPVPHVAMNRFGEASEITDLVLFLASDESSFSTGAEFVADGGERAGNATPLA